MFSSELKSFNYSNVTLGESSYGDINKPVCDDASGLYLNNTKGMEWVRKGIDTLGRQGLAI